ncbi:DUF2306 domain-containing protein [Pontibacter akesuensis]|uniref:DUF2306 domain-containing protein n=1 Tax=Pontibacter akesuensis TaxID=388950 RepID=A0A1I7HTH9_9BACT|nr:hypothetical protein [Pontibacter akesuensis]GHA63504.1 hypothetical protein GCM10007389_15070 [Pontibacter akesuensis]SFU64034.1 hypothetical protein SAMN04487941_1666 [Pontibacter akesuensis]
METLFTVLLILHIAAGTISLIAGPVSMVNRKGGKQHRLTGKIFFYAMMLVSGTAVTMAALPNHHSPFLLIIGVFSAYLVISGYRVLNLKGLAKGRKPPLQDWGISLVMAAFAAYFVFAGFTGGSFDSSSIISIVFGSIALLLVAKDVRKYTKAPTDKNFWLYDHITRMIAGNIAAFTAFLVVNNTILPPVVAWLGPTVTGTAVISFFITKYKLKARKEKATGEVVAGKTGSN